MKAPVVSVTTPLKVEFSWANTLADTLNSNTMPMLTIFRMMFSFKNVLLTKTCESQ